MCAHICHDNVLYIYIRMDRATYVHNICRLPGYDGAIMYNIRCLYVYHAGTCAGRERYTNDIIFHMYGSKCAATFE